MPPFNFDDDFEDNYEEEVYESPSPSSDPIQERLDLASAYNALLKRGVFADGTPATDKVEREVQGFVRERLEVLMGVRPETSKTPIAVFSEEEVTILKAFATRIKTQGTVVTPSVKTPEPVPSLAPAPTIKTPEPPKRPTVKSPRPRAPRKPRVAVSPPKPEPQQTVSMTLDKNKKYPSPRSKEEAEQVPDNDVFKIGPKYYMWRTNDLGTRYRVNVTPQAGQTKANDLYVAMPTGAMFTAVTAAISKTQAEQGRNASDMGGRDIE